MSGFQEFISSVILKCCNLHMTSSKHLTHTFHPSNHYDTTPDWDRLKDTREPGADQRVHPNFHPSTFLSLSLAQTRTLAPPQSLIWSASTAMLIGALPFVQHGKCVIPEDVKDCLQNAAVRSSRMHNMSCENISLEMLSTAIYYCEDIERLEEEPWWRTHRPLTNSLQ